MLLRMISLLITMKLILKIETILTLKIGILHYVSATTNYFFGSKRLPGWFVAKSAPKCLYDRGVGVKLSDKLIHRNMKCLKAFFIC